MSAGPAAPPPHRGEIWPVLLSSQKSERRTARPALVVSIDVRNRLAGDIIVVPLSTNLRPLATHVLIAKGIGGLRQDSVARCEQVTTLDKQLLGRGPLGGAVPDAVLNDVVRGIRRAVGQVFA